MSKIITTLVGTAALALSATFAHAAVLIDSFEGEVQGRDRGHWEAESGSTMASTNAFVTNGTKGWEYQILSQNANGNTDVAAAWIGVAGWGGMEAQLRAAAFTSATHISLDFTIPAYSGSTGPASAHSVSLSYNSGDGGPVNSSLGVISISPVTVALTSFGATHTITMPVTVAMRDRLLLDSWQKLYLRVNSPNSLPIDSRIALQIDNVRTSAIPEPSSFAAFAGLAGIASALSRRRALRR